MKNTQHTLGLLSLCLFLTLTTTGWTKQSFEIDYHDDTALPEGKLGALIQNFMATVNSNDADKVKTFIENSTTENFRTMAPIEMHQDQFANFYERTGGIDFHSIRSYEPNRTGETVVIFKDKNYGLWHGATFGFSKGKDYLIERLGFSGARIPSSVLNLKIPESEFIEKSKKLVEDLCKKDKFSGTVLIAKGDKILYETACGEASKRFHVKNNLDTKFNLGSMNKMFTATAIMQLVEKGQLKLEDPISTYVDESWLPVDITDGVTVHHLLTHSSGLGSYFNDTYWNASRALHRSIEDFKPLVQGDSLAFAPGQRFQYSNTGMLLLGVIIEEVTGKDYFDYISENIYEPAEMTNSDSYEMDVPVENLAIGYVPTANNSYGWENNIYKHVIKGGPAGGGFSTIRDLHKFALALQREKLVSKSSLDRLWTDYLKEGYGYGFGVQQGASGKVVGHGGGFPGLNSNLDIYLDQGYVVVVMSNYDRAASPIAQKIKHLIDRL